MDIKFKEVFDLFKNDIYRLSYSYTKSFAEADDITQNVFIKLYNHQEILEKDIDEIKKWLIKVTINESKTFLKSLWRKRVVLFDSNENDKTEGQVYEKNESILDEILKLPKKYRTVIFLYYYEDYKIKEIKEILNISETNIQSILLRARKKLKEMLKEEIENE